MVVQKLPIYKWLLGELKPCFPDSRLPRKIDILNLMFYQQSVQGKNFQQSLQFVADEVIKVWNSGSIPTILRHRVVSNIDGLVKGKGNYEAIKKNRKRQTDTQSANENDLKRDLQQLFDISHHDIKNAEILKFLRDQRTKRILNIDWIKSVVNEIPQQMKKYHGRKVIKADEVMSCVDDESSDGEISDDPDDKDYKCNLKPVVRNKRKKKINRKSSLLHKMLNSTDVLTSLDRANIENNQFLYVAAAIAKANNEDINKCTLSYSSLYRNRIQSRTKLAKHVKQEFTDSIDRGLVIHWDGKKMPDSTNPNRELRRKKIERLGIAVSGNGGHKTLSVKRLNDGTGKCAAKAVFNVVKEYKAAKNIIGMSTDTTSANTGENKGACVEFEKEMGRNILYLPCRHHIYEVLIGGVFEKLFGPTKGPENKLFEKFQNHWPMINKKQVNTIDPSFFQPPLAKRLKNDTIKSLKKILAKRDVTKYIPRGDYRELIELCLVFLGEKIPGFTFKLPSAFGNARWMVKVIYMFKMYFFRDQFPKVADLEVQIREFCLFSSLIYVKAWIECPITTDAAINDLQLFKNILQYSKLNEEISVKAIDKLENHLWYLGSELVVLSLFSDKISTSVKQKMMDKINVYDSEWTERSLKLETSKNLQKKNLIDLVGYPSKAVLLSLGIPAVEFMFAHKANTWNTSSEFLEVCMIEYIEHIHNS